jgi:hypothetical protein
MKTIGVAGLLMSLLLFSPTMALADAIGPAPACPPGAQGDSSHEGPSCTPARCKTDADCERRGLDSCQNWRVCSATFDVQYGGRGGYSMGTYPAEYVFGSCSPSEMCTGLEEAPPAGLRWPDSEEVECSIDLFCVPKTLPALPRRAPPEAAVEEGSETEDRERSRSRKDDSTCGCAWDSPSAVSWAWLGLFGGIFLTLRSRP